MVYADMLKTGSIHLAALDGVDFDFNKYLTEFVTVRVVKSPNGPTNKEFEIIKQIISDDTPETNYEHITIGHELVTWGNRVSRILYQINTPLN